MLRFKFIAISLLALFALGLVSYFAYRLFIQKEPDQLPLNKIPISSINNSSVIPLTKVGVSVSNDLDKNQKTVSVAGKMISFEQESTTEYTIVLEIPTGEGIKTVNVNMGKKDNNISELKYEVTSTDERVKFMSEIYKNINIADLYTKYANEIGKIIEVQLLSYANIAELSKTGCNTLCEQKIKEYERFKDQNTAIVGIQTSSISNYNVGSVVRFYLVP